MEQFIGRWVRIAKRISGRLALLIATFKGMAVKAQGISVAVGGGVVVVLVTLARTIGKSWLAADPAHWALVAVAAVVIVCLNILYRDEVEREKAEEAARVIDLPIEIFFSRETSAEARLGILNKGDDGNFSARAEVIRAEADAPVPSNAYRPPWIEGPGPERPITAGGDAYLKLATTDTTSLSQRDIVELQLWQAAAPGKPDVPWDTVRWNAKEDEDRKSLVPKIFLRVTISRGKLGTTAFRPREEIVIIECSRHGGCSVRAANPEEQAPFVVPPPTTPE